MLYFEKCFKFFPYKYEEDEKGCESQSYSCAQNEPIDGCQTNESQYDAK